ncbi:MAG: glycosyltransferase family 4 protein [Terriglobales bacterium]
MKEQRSTKVVVFAHVPPPFHGQSYMIELLLDGLRTEAAKRVPLEIHHVDARFSADASEIGSAGIRKVFRAIWYSLQAIAIRLRHKVDILYYVPAPARRAPLYRDWFVMALCRPFFRKVVFHWHAVGLGEWLKGEATRPERLLTDLLMGQVELSIVLSEFARGDAAVLQPKRVVVIPNGVTDSCPHFEQRKHEPKASFTILFLAACTRQKGLFATVDAAELLQPWLTDVRVRLIVAGEFPDPTEHGQFIERVHETHTASIEYVGFADASAKARLFNEADCLCFPSKYPHEAQPVSIIEALAYDLPVVATRWRGIPEMLDGTTSFLVDDQSPESIADALRQARDAQPHGRNRQRFLERFERTRFSERITAELMNLTQRPQ